MAKKRKMLDSEEDAQLASAVRDSAQQIWQAGVGAFVKEQEDGDRKLEQIFEERVARALAALGVPTRQDWQALNARVDQLSKALEAFSGTKRAAPKAPAKSRAKTAAGPKGAA